MFQPQQPDSSNSDLAPRWDSWLLSLCLHAAVLTWTVVWSLLSPNLPYLTQSVFDDEFSRQKRAKPLYYIPLVTKLPEVSPAVAVSVRPQAAAPLKSLEQPIVSRTKSAAEVAQSIDQITASVASLPSEPAPKPRKAPLPPGPTAPAPTSTPSLAVLDSPPVSASSSNLPATALAIATIPQLPRVKPKVFVPPPSAGRTKSGVTATESSLEKPPDLGTSVGPGLRADVAVVPGLAAPKPVAASAPGVPSRAPELGAADFGRENLNRERKVPDLMIGSAPPPRTSSPSDTKSAPEVFTIEADSLRYMPSIVVPMLAGSRVLPRWVEQEFPSKTVYSVVLPMAKSRFRRYSGDWIAWFTEAESGSSAPIKMQPPVPLRKQEVADHLVPPGEQGREVRVSLLATLNVQGGFEWKRFLRDPGPELGSLVRQDLDRWKFFPARRDGRGVHVDVLLEIPYWVSPHSFRDLPR